MIKNRIKYKELQTKLDSVNIITTIIRINKNRYDLIINFQVIKSFKQRKSCNKRILKLYNTHFKQ